MSTKILEIKNLNSYYQDTKVLKDINMDFQRNRATAIMGPSGCGKTTLIRCINRMHELTGDARVEGSIFLEGTDLNKIDPIEVRRYVGMVFQKPNPFPTMSIYDNVIAGYKLNGIKMKKQKFDEIVEESLNHAALFEEVKDKLYRKGSFLSGGQQQRLCIARALAMKPKLLLLDEPTSALDPIATKKIEDLVELLKKEITIIMVTHNTGQAARISDNTAFLYLGELIEFGDTKQMFSVPKDKRTEEYLIGKFG